MSVMGGKRTLAPRYKRPPIVRISCWVALATSRKVSIFDERGARWASTFLGENGMDIIRIVEARLETPAATFTALAHLSRGL